MGKAKKGGAGGKYTWGGMLTEDQDGNVATDHNDPNYDSDEDGMAVSLQYEYAEDLQAYKLAVKLCSSLPCCFTWLPQLAFMSCMRWYHPLAAT